MHISKQLLSLTKQENYYQFETNAPTLRLYFLTDDIVRIRVAFDKQFKEESYTLMLTAWADRLDSLFPERKQITALNIEAVEHVTHYVLASKTLDVHVYKNPVGIKVFNKVGELLHSDLLGKSYVQDSLGRIYHYKQSDVEDAFYGFGEKTGVLNKMKSRMRMAFCDTLGYDATKTDPLYKHIPFYIKLDKQSNATGLFYHNTYEGVFDMGLERSGYWPLYNYYSADGGDIDLFFINGPQISSVIDRYTELTGKPAFLPMYALGYLGSTMYYVELAKDCDREILNFVNKCIDKDIPIDNFHLSSGYTVDHNNKRNVFTWNAGKFSDPAQFFQQMEDKGVRVTPNIKPGVLLTHPDYGYFTQNDCFIYNHDDKTPYVDNWWGGLGSFFDLTNPKARAIWSNKLVETLLSKNAQSIWNDNCEYDSVTDRSLVCDFDGAKAPIARLRAIMPNIMGVLAKQALTQIYPNQRPYIVNRAGFAGIQYYAQTWAGDNNTSWDSLKYNIPTILGMGLSGVANNGCDIGGFWGGAPEPELFVRWVQNGIFQPRFSIHSCNTDNSVTEPWMYPEFTHYIRDAIKLRYAFMPYFYALLYQAHKTGAPIMRPMVYEFQSDKECRNESFDFMLGSSLLVANVLEAGATTRIVNLPKQSDWYDFYSRQPFTGGSQLSVDVELDSIPLFIRDNAIIPMTSGLMSVSKQDITHLHYIIACKDKVEFTIFEDDGLSFNYQSGQHLTTHIQACYANRQLTLDFIQTGNLVSSVESILLDVIHSVKGALAVSVAGDKLPQFLDADDFALSNYGWYYNLMTRSVMVKYPNLKVSHQVLISYEHFDLIGM